MNSTTTTGCDCSQAPDCVRCGAPTFVEAWHSDYPSRDIIGCLDCGHEFHRGGA